VATLTAWTRSDPFRWLSHEVAVADQYPARYLDLARTSIARILGEG
jgi:hypothetical protein